MDAPPVWLIGPGIRPSQSSLLQEEDPITRSVRCLARLALLAIVCSCATGPLSVHAGGMLTAPTVAVAAGRLTLRVSPARVVLGQRFTVLLVGAQPRVVYTLVMAPRHAQGFGGGLMGRYRADGHGLARFSYPGPMGRSVFYTVRPDGTGVRSLDLSRSRQETVVGWAAHP